MKTPEEKKHELDLRYLRMARIWAENSYCERRKVGALIVKDKMIFPMATTAHRQDLKTYAKTKTI